MLPILILEDDETVLVNLRTYFEDEGYEVYIAKTGEEALHILQIREIGTALIEVRIPGIDGNKVIEEGLRIRPKLRVFIHTASMDYHLPDSLKALGVSSEQILVKSYTTLAQLSDKIRNKL